MSSTGNFRPLQASEDHSVLTLYVQPLLCQSARLDKEIKDFEGRLGRLGHNQRHKLKCRIGQIRRQKDIIDEQLRKHFELYAKATCKSLCEKVWTCLPREIRDIIYDYVHAHDTIYVGPEYLRTSDEPCESDRGAHYWDPEYVGDAVKLEMVESWYRTTLFYFYDKANNTQVIDQFLVTDRWDLGLKPHEFICKVRIDLGPSDNKLHNTWHCCEVRGLADTITRPLKNLDRLPNHTHFVIRVHTYRGLEFGCLRDYELQRTVEVIVHDLKALRDSGHRLIVEWPEAHHVQFYFVNRDYEPPAWLTRLINAGNS
ncbi:hypothetical protein N0V83_000591 [Neocucurbitaria cava]|uniref:Uncharacterized protein n=1 Tax=Neocucurbitaria cava TaxID=798079 RepID=A0A9W8YHE3_9PLEO|nr:hypothetical protein N0V83_000591 [Neocucurbitaria cava]